MYIPKNRIKTNQYTAGSEFVYKGSGEGYVGYYHQIYTGKYYTGKTPNDKPIIEIIKGGTETNNIWEATANDPSEGSGFSQYASNYDGFVPNRSETDMQDIDTYHRLKKTDFSDIKLLPQQFYPTPTVEDYSLGVFTRYFVVKVNEIVFIEVNKDTFTKITNQDPKWEHVIFTPFKIQWTLTGEKQEVFNTNRSIVNLEQSRLKRQGLDLFLRKNYLQFYQD